MNETKSFFSQLLILSGAVVGILAMGGKMLPAIYAQIPFAIATTVLFMILCTALFFAGRKAAISTQKLAFNNLVLSSVFGKMVLAIAWLLGFRSVAQPHDDWYVLIFLFIYVVFTVFEVIFMSKLARLKSTPTAEK